MPLLALLSSFLSSRSRKIDENRRRDERQEKTRRNAPPFFVGSRLYEDLCKPDNFRGSAGFPHRRLWTECVSAPDFRSKSMITAKIDLRRAKVIHISHSCAGGKLFSRFLQILRFARLTDKTTSGGPVAPFRRSDPRFRKLYEDRGGAFDKVGNPAIFPAPATAPEAKNHPLKEDRAVPDRSRKTESCPEHRRRRRRRGPTQRIPRMSGVSRHVGVRASVLARRY